MQTFNTLGVSDTLINALAKQGISTPADIQIKAYPVLNDRRDTWLSSPTGSGKTLAYLLPLLTHVDITTVDLQLAILAPTQELAVQIHECIKELYQNITPAPRTQLLIGNASMQRQKEKLKKKPHVVVGSCGRMLELGRERRLKLHKCRCIVIDEADNMLEHDKVERIEQFLKMTAHERQLVFASATDKTRTFATAQSLGSDVEWLQGEDKEASSAVEHYYIQETHHHKTDTLRKLLNAVKPDRAIVFLHRNATAELVETKMGHKDLSMVVLHGGLTKFDRQKALNNFRRGKVKILVSSDISARGLDIKGVTHIINLDAPSSSDDYTHRAGRTARMGATGTIISILAPNELTLLNRYERDLKIEILPAALHDGEFVTE